MPTLSTYPLGLAPVGYRKNGAPIFPIAGGAPTLVEQREAALTKGRDIVAKATGENRELTEDEFKAARAAADEAKAFAVQIQQAADSKALVAELGQSGKAAETEGKGRESGGDAPAATLGEHYVKHAGDRLIEVKGQRGFSVSAPEWNGPAKAATDTQTTGAAVYGPVLTQVDTTIVQAPRPRLVVADLLGSGTLSGNAISYFVEGALEGAFTTVAEGATKPQLHQVDPTVVTDMLKKIAGFIKLTDEMTEDLPFVVSEINGRLLYELARFEEQQLLNGNGTGTNVLGLLNRNGLQAEAAANATDNADAIFRAMTKVSTGSTLDPDGLVINPVDYQRLRLAKDGNNQYYGGGFFAGQYGQGGIPQQPPVWGLRTIVTPAIPVGTAVVGAFSQGATVYRKGGVRVESTNSNQDDFINNKVTIRAEERVALAVRVPAGFVKVTLNEPTA